jgi:CheY-like chemotaxis protein
MKPASIIYVDDDPDDRIFLKEAFEEQLFPSTLCFDSATSLLKYLYTLKQDIQLPKLIITDINMPVMTGLELLTLLKANTRFKHIKVIVLSTAYKLDYDVQCKQLGAADFIQKPSSFAEMRDLATYFLYQ